MKKIFTLFIILILHKISVGQVVLSSVDNLYTQDFNTLANSGTSSTLPTGWAFLETGTALNSLFSASTGSSSTGDTYSFGLANTTDRALGGLQSGSLTPLWGVSFVNNTGQIIKELVITYTGETWRVGTINRSDKIDFQYSTDATSLSTGTWIDENNLDYANPGQAATANGSVLHSSNVTFTIKNLNISNGATFWFRFQDVNASGADDGIGIDDFSLSTNVPPINTATYPKTQNVSNNSLDIVSNLNETGKTYFVVLPDGAAAPTITQIKAGQDAGGNVLATNLTGEIPVITKLIDAIKSVTGLTSNTSYDIYLVSEDDYGFTQSTSVKIDATTTNIASPIINTSASAIIFPGYTAVNKKSAAQSFSITASDLQSNVNVAFTGEYEISLDNVTFVSTNLSIPQATFNAGGSQIIYVRFASAGTTGTKSGTLTLSATNATDKNITLSAIAIDPYNQNFNDASYLTNSGWTQVNVLGTVNSWGYSTQNPYSAPGVATMNGFSDGSTASDDWLISPQLDLTVFSNLPVLSFFSRKHFEGSQLKLYVSTTYNGNGVINVNDWTELNGDFPTTVDVYKASTGISLNNYKTATTYIAFVYQSTSGNNNNSAEWKIDDFKVENLTNYQNIPNPSFEFSETASGNHSTSNNFSFSAAGYGDITITAPAGFTVSTNNTLFTQTVTIPQATISNNTTIYVRFSPLERKIKYAGQLNFAGNGLNLDKVNVSGSSVLRSETIDIATYNLEFFGSDVRGSDNVEFGPTNDALQITNVTSVIQRMNMDIIGLEEVSDDAAFNTLKTNLGYEGFLGTRWSYSFDPPSATFPPQKLGFLYNPATTTLVSSESLFENEYDQARLGNSSNITNYPGGSASSFWSSGRLPLMGTFDVTVSGITNRYRVIVLHAKSGSSASDYDRRLYDVNYLYNYLNTTYPNDKILIVGDYNDKVVGSISSNPTSSYNSFVADNINYSTLTKDISQVANAGTFIGGSTPSFIDHIITSNELNNTYASSSITVEDATTYISQYSNTTSDHLPVFARFTPVFDATLPVELSQFKASVKGNSVDLKWTTLQEKNNLGFAIMRSVDGKTFQEIGFVKSFGDASKETNYYFSDNTPMIGTNYYKLKQLDIDGKISFSPVQAIKLLNGLENILSVHPNPIEHQISINYASNNEELIVKLMSSSGTLVFESVGKLTDISSRLNEKIGGFQSGIYILQIKDGKTILQQKIIKN